MGFRINTNVASLQAQNALRKTTSESQDSLAKLSSGSRINKSSDDSAGLAISEKMKSEIRSANQASRNANEGISMIQVAEGALNETSSIVTRMRELAVQSSSDTIGDKERNMSELEFQQLKQEIDRISAATRFNGKNLLDGSEDTLSIQVGTGSNMEVDTIGINLQNLASNSESLKISAMSVKSKDGARSGLNSLDEAMDKISGQRAILGSVQNRLNSSVSNLSTFTENLSAANSRIRDVDYAEETAKQAKNSILTAAGTSVLAQANNLSQNVFKLIA